MKTEEEIKEAIKIFAIIRNEAERQSENFYTANTICNVLKWSIGENPEMQERIDRWKKLIAKYGEDLDLTRRSSSGDVTVKVTK